MFLAGGETSIFDYRHISDASHHASAFVGMGVIIALFPIPGLITKFIQAAQEKKMGKTDARIQTVTESESFSYQRPA